MTKREEKENEAAGRFPAERSGVGSLPRLDEDIVVKLSPEEVARIFEACFDRDVDMACEIVVELQKKIRRVLERPHCVPVFEMNRKLSDK